MIFLEMIFPRAKSFAEAEICRFLVRRTCCLSRYGWWSLFKGEDTASGKEEGPSRFTQAEGSRVALTLWSQIRGRVPLLCSYSGDPSIS